MKNDPIEKALGQLDGLRAETPGGRTQLAKALEAKSNLVVAKAARILGDAQLTELTDPLATTFTRLLKAGTPADKGCAAKLAIARALNKLEFNDADLFLAGMRHKQREPVWGGSEDTASELRAVCAMGLAGSTYHLKLRELVDLLADREWPARAGAIRALAAIGSDGAGLLLRLKALTGDKEPEVMSECLSGLLAVSGADALPLLMSFASLKPSENDDLREIAILALGTSRRPDAVELLIGLFDRTADPEGIRCLALGLACSRTEQAIAYLIQLLRNGSTSSAASAREALEAQQDSHLQELIRLAIEGA